MYKVKILKEGIQKYGSSFESKEELEAWLEKAHYSKGRTKENGWVIEIKDLTNDYDYKLSLIKLARKKEYPSWEEVNEALIENMEGNPRKLELVKLKRKRVKERHPKPIREELKNTKMFEGEE